MVDTATTTTDGFALADFVVPKFVQYLGVRSLVRFGATCSSHQHVVSTEVERRKKCVIDIEKEVMQLMGTRVSGKKMEQINTDSAPTRENVMRAKELVDTAKSLIDDEINFHHKLGTKELRVDDDEEDYYFEDGYDWKEYDFFLEERKKFMYDYSYLGSLYLLPDCFYVPPEGNPGNPSKEVLEFASKKAGWIWGAEDHMGSVYERAMWDDNWDKLNYEQPFQKFHLSGADFFTYECMEDTAYDLALKNGGIDAFRIAARKVFFRAPASRDCLWYTLTKADEFASNEAWKQEKCIDW